MLRTHCARPTPGFRYDGVGASFSEHTHKIVGATMPENRLRAPGPRVSSARSPRSEAATAFKPISTITYTKLNTNNAAAGAKVGGVVWAWVWCGRGCGVRARARGWGWGWGWGSWQPLRCTSSQNPLPHHAPAPCARTRV